MICLEKTALGIELGSTRIKAVLIGEDHTVLASGDHEWENRWENGWWTYSLGETWVGIQAAYAALADAVQKAAGTPLTTVGAIGISAMMHGYLPFDADGRQLAAFRTWRNTGTEAEACALTETFRFPIPQRWSVAHLYHAMRGGEEHVRRLAFLTTLAGYVHWRLTGQKVLGIGDASGMFPVDGETGTYQAVAAERFDTLIAKHGYSFRTEQILPRVLRAGEAAGTLTEEGARLLDPSGRLRAGIPFCPPEGDAGTGMVATNSVASGSGNISAGTSVFAMAVLEKELSGVYPEIDIVTTPTGKPTAMVHANSCTSDLDAWVRLLGEAAEAAGARPDRTALYTMFYRKALEGEPDCGGLLSYNFYSGEPVVGLTEGCPLFMRRPDAKMTLANFSRAQLYAAISALKLGMDILLEREQVSLHRMMGHGGLFKVEGVGQRLLAGALGVPVAVMDTAGEGGPWGMAVLAAYRMNRQGAQTLEQYLNERVFVGARVHTVQPDAADAEGFLRYIRQYQKGLAAEKAAAAVWR